VEAIERLRELELSSPVKEKNSTPFSNQKRTCVKTVTSDGICMGAIEP